MGMFRAVGVCAAIALVTLSAPAFSDSTATIVIPEADESIILPPGSPLHFRAFGAEHAVEFAGRIELTGTFYYGDNEYNDLNTPDLTLYFVPDKASMARLPRFKQRGQPGDINLTNATAFLDAVVPKAERLAAQKKGTKYLSSKVDIWVDGLEAGIECDAPFFNAHFLSVAHPPMRVALADLPDEGC